MRQNEVNNVGVDASTQAPNRGDLVAFREVS